MALDNFLDLRVADGRELYIAPPISDTDPRADPSALAAVLMRVLADPASARAAVGRNASRFIDDHFTIEKVAEQHLDALANLVAQRRVRAGRG